MATILNNKKSTGGSPYCYYTVTANTSNRTAYGVTISGTISAHLASSSSSLQTGSTMGLNAYLTFNGVEQSAVNIKGTGTSWSGTTTHSTNYSFTISDLDPSQTVIPVSFRVSRTGSAAGDYTRGAALSSTDCNDIIVEAGLIASTITSVSSGTTDYAPSVVWTPCATSVKFKVKYSYGSWNYTTGIISPSTTSPYTYSGYSITGANLASYMASGSGTFTATLYTYDSDGTTQIGSASSKTFTVTLNSSYKPTASVGTFTDAGGIVPSGWGVFVQGKSKLSFTVSATASTGSTISSYSTSVNGATYNTTSITTGWLTGSGSANLTVTDSRGRTATASRSYTVYPYSNPVIIVAYVTRCLSDGTPSDTGTCLLYTFASTISTCNGNNTATYELGYREKGSNSAYTYVTAANDVPNSVYTGYNFVATTSYDIRFRVTDAFGSVAYDDESIGSSFKLVHYNKNKQAIAIGKYSSAGTNEKKFEVAMPVEVNSNLNVDGTVNGNKIVLLTSSNSDGNFNNITNSGIYGIRVSPVNGPVGNWGTLYVQNTDLSGTLYQIYIADVGTIYKRNWNTSSNVWNNWTKLDAGNADYATSAGSATTAATATLLSSSSSGQGTGAVLNGRGGNYIYSGPNDSANGTGGALNNLVISSWWGISFTTSCGGQTYTGTNAVSIDCRNGTLWAKKIYEDGSRVPAKNDFTIIAKKSSNFTLGSSGSQTDGFWCDTPGYKPIAIAGFECRPNDYGTYVSFAYCYIDSIQDGGCNCWFRVRNNRAANAGTTYVQVYLTCVPTT